MSVYLQGGLVLLNGGNVATSAGCCCGGGGGCYRFTFLAEHVAGCFTLEDLSACTPVEMFFQFTSNFTTDDTCATLNLNDSGTNDFGFGPFNWYVNSVDNGDNTYDLFYGLTWSGFTMCGVSDTISVDFVKSGLTCNVDQFFSDNKAECEGSGSCTSADCPGAVGRSWLATSTFGSAATATIGYECCPCCNNGSCSNISASDCTASGGTCSGSGVCADANGACCAFGTCFDDVNPSTCTDIFGGTFQGPCTTCILNPCP